VDLGVWASSPLHAPIARWLTRLEPGRFPTIEDLNALVPQVSALPPGFRFGAALEPVAATEYERGIASTGEVPVRAHDWHDLFNALAWLSFPRLKASLNRCHVAAMSASAPGARLAGQRGALRDLATLLDESGMLVACEDPTLVEALAAHAWHTLLVERRLEVCRSMRFAVCGHAIFDRARVPRKALTARVLVLPVDRAEVEGEGVAQIDRLDTMAARWLDRLALQCIERADAMQGLERTAPSDRPGRVLEGTRVLLHMPVMGVPGWFAANADPTFYDDPQVFRRAAIAP
jgi:hypothetical protein